MDLGLSGRNVLVTGGSSGIGRATAELFAAEGANVGLTYRENRELGESVARAIEERFEVAVSAFACNLASEASIQECFRLATETFDSVEVLVNNAGYWPSGYVEEITLSEWKECIDANLTGHMLFSREFLRHRISLGLPGRITNVVSFVGFTGSTTGHSHYASAKAGLIAFTKSLAREGCRHRVAVNAVSPGMVKTNMTAEVTGHRLQEYLKRVPLGRFAEPSEIAEAIVFLSSERAGYITGATMDVSGGLLMH